MIAARGTRWVHGTFDDWLQSMGTRSMVVEIYKPGYLPEHLPEMSLSHLRAFNPAPRDREAHISNVLPALYGFYEGILDGLGL